MCIQHPPLPPRRNILSGGARRKPAVRGAAGISPVIVVGRKRWDTQRRKEAIKRMLQFFFLVVFFGGFSGRYSRPLVPSVLGECVSFAGPAGSGLGTGNRYDCDP